MAVAVVCPRCRGALAATETSVDCRTCGASYPVWAAVPLLTTDGLTAQQVAQRRYFDAEFAGYESYELENWRLSYIERIFGALRVLDRRGPYLDVGVGGSGATVIEAARRGVEAVGCDLSPTAILTARRSATAEGVERLARFVVCAAERLPFGDDSFAAASAVAVLEHLDDDRAAAAELRRVTSPGGLVWVTVPHSFRYMPPPVWPLYRWHDRRIGHKRHYDERRLARLFTEAGLEHVQTLFSAHPVKIAQLVVERLVPGARRPRSPVWWRLEALDRRAERRRLGALHLSMVLRRPRH